MTTKITDKNISNIANKFIQWQSVITADGSTSTSAIAGRGYFIDTTSAAHTITLPSSPSIGDSIAIKDYAGTFATYKLTIGRNGSNIQGAANDSLIQTNRASVTLVYVDSTRGWVYSKESNVADLQLATFITATGGTITTSGNYKIHTFTGDGCFVVSSLGNPAGGPNNVDYLVVAGGGAGSGNNYGDGAAGGGAGGYRTTFPSPGCNAGAFPITATTYPITVGGGGAGAGGGSGNSGSNSIFSTITSTGGGFGAVYTAPGGPGGSGGGGGGKPCGSTARSGGSGNTPSVSPPQGNNGGPGYTSCSPGANRAGGGGGGAGGVGATASPGVNSAGGTGAPNAISGGSVTYAVGGSGRAEPNCGSGTGSAGTTNRGNGGSGAASGGAGGKGIVIIRYKYQ